MSDESNDELQQIRKRLHDLSDVVHGHVAALAVQKVNMDIITKDVAQIIETCATKEQVQSATTILTLKLDQLRLSQAPKPDHDTDSQAITRRDVNVAVGVGVIAISGIVWLFLTFGPYLKQ